jgi:hypothetical protein
MLATLLSERITGEARVFVRSDSVVLTRAACVCVLLKAGPHKPKESLICTTITNVELKIVGDKEADIEAFIREKADDLMSDLQAQGFNTETGDFT